MSRLRNVRHRRGDALSRVGWSDFEALLADYYRRQGYSVEHVGTGGTGARFDGGIDLKLRRDDEYIVVQCKHWNAKQVPHNDVHQLLGIMVNEGATGAILISSGEFTAYARESAARQGHVQLIDGDALRAMIGPLPESPVPTGDSDARWQPGFVDAQPAPDTAPRSAAGPEALVFRARRASTRRPRARTHATPNLAWGLLALVCAVTFFLLIRALLERTAWSAGNSEATMQSAPAEMLPIPSGEAPAVMDAAPSGAQPGLIDGVTGTTIEDRLANMPPPRQPSAAEIRESRRKADAAMKLLEADTPEM